jgi:hypothetical protein
MGMRQLTAQQNGGQPIAEPEGSFYWNNGSLVDFGDDVLLRNVIDLDFSDTILTPGENCIRLSQGALKDTNCTFSYSFHCALTGEFTNSLLFESDCSFKQCKIVGWLTRVLLEASETKIKHV